MRTRKEAVIQLCFAISGWATKRGRAYLRHEEKEFERADKIIDHWIEQLEEFIKLESLETEK